MYLVNVSRTFNVLLLQRLKVAVTVSVQEFVMGIKEMPRLARFIPKIMLAITVTACDEVYRKIACWLNDMGEASPWKAQLLFVCFNYSSATIYLFIANYKNVWHAFCFIPQKTIDSRVPMKKISSSKWSL